MSLDQVMQNYFAALQRDELNLDELRNQYGAEVIAHILNYQDAEGRPFIHHVVSRGSKLTDAIINFPLESGGSLLSQSFLILVCSSNNLLLSVE